MAKAKKTEKTKSLRKTGAKKPEKPQKKPAANKDKPSGINEGLYYCSFCKKSPSADEDRLIAGPNKIFIMSVGLIPSARLRVVRPEVCALGRS